MQQLLNKALAKLKFSSQAIADLMAKPPARMEKPANMPWARSEVEDHRREWKREEKRVESAKLHQTVAKLTFEMA